MARESQGLQVLLIVFVMLTVVLGVRPFFTSSRPTRRPRPSRPRRPRSKQVKDEKKTMKRKSRRPENLDRLPERSTEDIKKQFAEDMQTYGNGRNRIQIAASCRQAALRPQYALLQPPARGHAQVIQDRTDELIKARAEAADLQTKFKNREAAKDGRSRRCCGLR